MDLFDTSGFVARSQCGDWTATLLFLNKFSNAVIAISYFTIPAILTYYYWHRRKIIPKSGMIINFALFIFLCGCTHILEITVFHWPAYRFMTLMQCLTAIFSFTTAIMLPKFVQFSLRLRSPEEYEMLLRSETDARQKLNDRQEQTEQIVEAIKEELENIKFNNATRAQYSYLQDLLKKVKDGSK